MAEEAGTGLSEVIELGDEASATEIANMDDEAFGRMSGLIPPDGKVEHTDEGDVIEDEVEVKEEKEEKEEEKKEDDTTRTQPETKTDLEEEEGEVKEEGSEEAKGEVKEGEQKEGEEEEEEKEEVKLLTEFSVHEGEEEKEIPLDLTFTFMANKKERVDVPIDKVVLMAQMGFYNEEREQQVLAAKEFVSAAQQENKELRQAFQAVATRAERLLTDESFFETSQSEFARLNSPEERAQRAEEELAKVKNEGTQSNVEADAQTFIAQNLAPAMEKIVNSYSSVSEDEVMGRFHRLTAPMLVNGIVPLNRLNDVEKIIKEDIANWAQQVHLERDSKEELAEKKVKAARTKTTLAKKQIARKTKPTGKADSQMGSPKKKAYASAEEWLADLDGIVADSLS